MNKVSSKLAASVRKVKGQDEKSPAPQPAAAQPARATETRSAATAPKPSPAMSHPERVWPD